MEPHGPAADRWGAVLARVDHLLSGPVEVSELPGGLTNVNLLLAGRQRSLVVRITQPGSALLAIDRDCEHANSVAAAAAGVGAPVVEYLPDAGVLVVEYIDGRTFTDDDLRSGEHLARVARACRRLHAGPRFVNDFDMFAIQRRYRDVVRRRGFRIPQDYDDFAPHVERISAAMGVDSPGTVPCHNDLLAGNFVDDGTRLWLIDYEYAGNNDACFELGNIWSEAGLTLDQLGELMTAYDGALLPHRVARARLWGLMSKYGWTLWASIQHAESTFDFDFWEWGMEKYERAVEEFRGRDFERLLDEVASRG